MKSTVLYQAYSHAKYHGDQQHPVPIYSLSKIGEAPIVVTYALLTIWIHDPPQKKKKASEEILHLPSTEKMSLSYYKRQDEKLNHHFK